MILNDFAPCAYDEVILEPRSGEPRSAKEIVEHIDLVVSNHIRVAILDPLIETEYLIPTTEALHSPNLKYLTKKGLFLFSRKKEKLC
jgi:hypothetical protein